MRAKTIKMAALAALMAAGLGFAPGAAQAEDCKSWSEARSAGWIEQFHLRPAADIKKDVEARHKGKVVNFVLCQEGGKVVYKMSVFQPSGNVVFVTEPAQ